MSLRFLLPFELLFISLLLNSFLTFPIQIKKQYDMNFKIESMQRLCECIAGRNRKCPFNIKCSYMSGFPLECTSRNNRLNVQRARIKKIGEFFVFRANGRA